ncbi:hypothetical protein GBAR_LOCUS17873, partial [Geodia barretti]
MSSRSELNTRCLGGEGAANPASSGATGATDDERINIFRLCRLVLDIFPNVLRIIFKNEFQQKFCCSW